MDGFLHILQAPAQGLQGLPERVATLRAAAFIGGALLGTRRAEK